MRIAQVSPLFESVPPQRYGGTERVVSYLTEELVRRGHEVTLYASGDSQTGAELIPIVPRALRLSGTNCVPTVYETLMLERVLSDADRYDVIHFHTDHLHYPLVRRLNTPAVTTLHGRLDMPELQPLYAEFDDVPVVSISDAQRRPVRGARWLATVYHGLPRDLYTFHPQAEDYFAFVGRISPEKRVDRAIEIATRLGVPLRIAAKVDKADRDYFEQEIRPLLDHPLVDFVGEIDDGAKNDFMGRARALLFPIDWPEPFGLVMIEAMACGTPVVAWRNGSTPEVIDDGVTGFVVDHLDQAVEAARRVGELDRRRCRDTFERRFCVERMADDYLRAYRRLLVAVPSRPLTGVEAYA